MSAFPLLDVAVHLRPEDNVVVAARTIPAGADVEFLGDRMRVARQIKMGHKLAIRPIRRGEAVLKYGQVIGFAGADIEPGDHVHVHNVRADLFERDYAFCRDCPPPVRATEMRTFEGYDRGSQRQEPFRYGTRNYIAILSTVNCSASTNKYVCERIRASGILQQFPNVDGVLPLTHKAGCAMQYGGADHNQLDRTLAGFAKHANIGAYILMGLGCETGAASHLVENQGLIQLDGPRSPKPLVLTIQECGGIAKTVEAGVKAVIDMLPRANDVRRTTLPASKLILGTNCGGSDGNSGVTANPALGVAADLLIAQGGTSVLAETPEIYGAEHLLTRRAVSPAVGQKLIDRIKWWEWYTSIFGTEINNNPSPGNKEGGLTTIYEKSLGAIAKGGSTALVDVVEYAEAIRAHGLVVMDTPGYDPVSMTGIVAGGANILAFTTGRGSVFGCKPSPSLKIATNTPLYEHMIDDMDIDAGVILTGTPVEVVGKRIFDELLLVASGRRTKSEIAGVGEEEFAAMGDRADVVTDAPSDAHEERLAAALNDVASAGPIDWTQVRDRYPDLADELRQLLAVGQVVDDLARRTTSFNGPKTASPPPTAPLPRRFDRYDLVEELGRGGMGVVYKAWDEELSRHVAIKMILRGHLASEQDQARFRTEAKAAAGLTHPNIVPVYQVGESDGQAYFCMKFVPGPALNRLVADGPLPQREAAAIVRDIARAVQHAHEHGILHRDLKPSNVLLDEGRPLVADFGLAKRATGDASITGTGAILGTPSYMAPEQAEAGASVGPASDVYSLGAILYETLTGRPPFLASSPVDTLLLVRTEDAVRPKLLNPNLDLDIELICRKCLEKDPRHRYVTAGRLADDLDAFLAGEPVSARTSSVTYLLTRFFRDTHHAQVLENWGLLWMWHSLLILFLCGVTAGMYAGGMHGHMPYLVLWSVGLVVWGWIFWNLRRLGGPVTFVERQIGHAWSAGVIGSIGVFVIEVLLERPALSLTPILAILAGMVFVFKAGTLSGWFYGAAAAMFLSAVPMAIVGPPWSVLLFGVVSAVTFFVPGLKYYRQRLRRG